MRLSSVEALLAGATAHETLRKHAGDAAAEEAEIITDVRGSAPYKRELLRVYIGRAVRAALDQSGSKP
jgi:carbon-monoxide dehydrogenase medium subunit